MKRKKINLSIPEQLADQFLAEAAERYDQKKIWLCATAAIMMYQASDEANRARWEQLAMRLAFRGDSEEHTLRSAAMDINARRAKKQSSKQDQDRPTARGKQE